MARKLSHKKELYNKKARHFSLAILCCCTALHSPGDALRNCTALGGVPIESTDCRKPHTTSTICRPTGSACWCTLTGSNPVHQTHDRQQLFRTDQEQLHIFQSLHLWVQALSYLRTWAQTLHPTMYLIQGVLPPRQWLLQHHSPGVVTSLYCRFQLRVHCPHHKCLATLTVHISSLTVTVP